jgi:hypothetical protein
MFLNATAFHNTTQPPPTPSTLFPHHVHRRLDRSAVVVAVREPPAVCSKGFYGRQASVSKCTMYKQETIRKSVTGVRWEYGERASRGCGDSACRASPGNTISWV